MVTSRLENEKLIISRISKIMKNKKITQTALATELNMSQSSISKILNKSKGYHLNESLLRKICNILDVDYEVIISISSIYSKHSDVDDDMDVVSFLKRMGVELNKIKIQNEDYIELIYHQDTKYMTTEDFNVFLTKLEDNVSNMLEFTFEF